MSAVTLLKKKRIDAIVRDIKRDKSFFLMLFAIGAILKHFQLNPVLNDPVPAG